jgi:branched-chain amino acid transport system substrate-binding protein
MALDEAQYQAGDLRIIYQDLDDATAARGFWDAAQEARNAQAAVSDPRVVAYLGTYNSGAAAISIPILCRANLVMVSPANTYLGLTQPTGEPGVPDRYYPNCPRNYARVVPTDDLQGTAGANWAAELGLRRVFVLDDGELYGTLIATSFAEQAAHLGLEVLGGPEHIDGGSRNYQSLAERIRETQPQLVYFGGVTQNHAGQLVRDLRAAMPEIAFMGPDGIYETAFLDAAGIAAEATYVTFNGVTPSQLTGAGAEWAAAYRVRFHSEPEAFAHYSYEMTKVVLAAIAKVNRPDRAAIRDAVLATQDFDGILGTWSFDPNGDTTLRTMSGRQVRGGKFDDEHAVIISAD